MMGIKQKRWVDAHFAGSISLNDERALRERLKTDETCRRYYERWMLLSELDPKGLSAEVRIGNALGIVKPDRRGLGPVGIAWASVIAAIFVLGLAFGPSIVSLVEEREFTARGQASLAGDPFAPLWVYQVSHGKSVLVSEHINPASELAFAYENRYGKPYLMIFGVDELRNVYWYYPAWQDSTENPRSLPIEKRPGMQELPDAITHRFKGSQLTLYAIFSDEAFSVKQVESLIAEAPLEKPLPLQGAEQYIKSYPLSADRSLSPTKE